MASISDVIGTFAEISRISGNFVHMARCEEDAIEVAGAGSQLGKVKTTFVEGKAVIAADDIRKLLDGLEGSVGA